MTTHFVHVGTTEFGSTWVHPDRITGFYIQKLEGQGGDGTFGAQLILPQGVEHLVDESGKKAFWPTFEEARMAVFSLLNAPADAGPGGAAAPVGRPGALMPAVDPVSVVPPRRRLTGLALIRNEHGDVLIVEKAHRQGTERFGLVGGHAQGDEAASVACHREIAEEIGLRIVPGRVLVVHHMPAAGGVSEGVSVVFDCGTVPADQPLMPPAGELVGYRWLEPARFAEVLAPYQVWCLELALSAASGGPVRYLIGHPNQDGAL
ncbi:NUDIX domain-containing protein [Streptomyces marincola]|uniref:Nudix hydrolase domain-containing protein n=1 Tax=Streptomyces marincola TaxID=2878388 RepID=A0A1W7CSR8_9ACTN|nr:NUDIX domain-containing protein [Streptomyces marincola]ARQ67746.1 hypothetical protein CAG99_01895 [Streptomyces marincola]